MEQNEKADEPSCWRWAHLSFTLIHSHLSCQHCFHAALIKSAVKSGFNAVTVLFRDCSAININAGALKWEAVVAVVVPHYYTHTEIDADTCDTRHVGRHIPPHQSHSCRLRPSHQPSGTSVQTTRHNSICPSFSLLFLFFPLLMITDVEKLNIRFGFFLFSSKNGTIVFSSSYFLSFCLPPFTALFFAIVQKSVQREFDQVCVLTWTASAALKK